MNYKLIPYQLKFKHPFRISHTIRAFTDNCYLIVLQGGSVGIGEAVYPPYVLDGVDELISVSKSLDQLHDFSCEAIIKCLEKNFIRHIHTPASFAALDMALVNWWCANNESTIAQFLNLPPKEGNWETSFTLGISSEVEFRKKLLETEPFTYVKLKVNEKQSFEIVNRFKKNSRKPFVVDANQGFTDKNKAKKFCDFLELEGVAYLEQPFFKEDLDNHNWLRQNTNLPIIADESFQSYEDLEKIAQNFDGINLKLMKCGGGVQAYKIIKRARELKLKIVLGCMSGSHIAIQYAENLAHLVDWVDLDGKFLIENNPSADFLQSFKE